VGKLRASLPWALQHALAPRYGPSRLLHTSIPTSNKHCVFFLHLSSVNLAPVIGQCKTSPVYLPVQVARYLRPNPAYPIAMAALPERVGNKTLRAHQSTVPSLSKPPQLDRTRSCCCKGYQPETRLRRRGQHVTTTAKAESTLKKARATESSTPSPSKRLALVKKSAAPRVEKQALWGESSLWQPSHAQPSRYFGQEETRTSHQSQSQTLSAPDGQPLTPISIRSGSSSSEYDNSIYPRKRRDESTPRTRPPDLP
jgi:hypothetical protein